MIPQNPHLLEKSAHETQNHSGCHRICGAVRKHGRSGSKPRGELFVPSAREGRINSTRSKHKQVPSYWGASIVDLVHFRRTWRPSSTAAGR